MKRMKKFFWVVGLCWLLPLAAGAATIYNVTPGGTGLNSLTGAIADADTHGGSDSIKLAAGTYTVSAMIQFGNQAETIVIIGTSGAALTNIVMSGGDRIFLINPPGNVSGVNVSIQGITFQNGAGDLDGFGGGAILGGGPLNTTTIGNCIFSSNSLAGLGNGGALAMEGGGTFTVTGCTFSKNSVTEGNGGAVYYLQQNGVTSSLTITNCTFKGNQGIGTTGNPAFGGAMRIEADAAVAGNTSAVSITQNFFDSNKVSGTGSEGGAINIENSWAGVTDFINFNRFYQNTGPVPDLLCNSSSSGGAVNITNNWWGINGGPLASGDPHVANTGTGTLTSSPWLELHTVGGTSSVCGGSGGSTAVMTAGFLTNSAGSTIAASNLGAMTGTPINFTATHGTISGAQSAIQSSGTATANFTANVTPSSPGATITADVQSIADSVSSTDAVAQALITIHAPTVAAGSTSGSVTAAAGDLVITDASCNQICNVVPSGASPVSGTVNASVTVDGSVQSINGTPYLVRHYDISPSAGASTATGTITLYFTQSDFDSYNLAVTGSGNKLPTASTDMTGRGNLTITQYHGTGTAPGNYTGWAGSGPAIVLITPGASNVVWDATNSWWTVTFSVTGFSGFFVTGPVGIPLPVTLETFSGQPTSGGVLLSWKVVIETGMSSYEVDGSSDGVGFTPLGTVAATGASGYQYFDASGSAGDHFYRLKMVNVDGTYSYSNIVLVKIATGGSAAVQVLGNPVAAACTLRIVAVSAGQVNLRLADLSGKVLWAGSARVGVGANTVVLPGMDRFAAGVYVLSVEGGQVKETVKVVKE